MNLNLQTLISLIFVSAVASNSLAAKETQPKGLLPEVVLDSSDEDKNQDTVYKSEMLITKSENKAIEALQKILLKKKGSAEEADLMYRLAELYMRRAKSGRYFDANFDPKKPGLRPNTLNQTAAASLNSAIKIYDNILAQFPKYANLDTVHFNLAIASMQTNQVEKAKTHYIKLTTDYTKSRLYPDALLDLGELYYNQHNFTTALEQLKKIENFPNSKAYPYGIYKSAWCYYNMKQNDLGINKLKLILSNNPADSTDVKKFNLRQEALRDLTLFVEDSITPDQLYTFFRGLTTDTELGEVILNLASLYESHSHHKELNIFVKEFIDKNETNPFVSKAYVRIIEANETLKSRELVLANMQKLSDVCSTSADVNCKTDFKKISTEISKKWWEVWLKNKNNIEFSKLTEKAFEIMLSKDDLSNPDTASRFAYAELLFQLGQFEKSSQNYELASLDPKLELSKKHDSLYGAIYSIDKLIEKDKKNEILFSEQQQQLTFRYVTEFPKGEFQEPLRFKLGFLAYQKQDTENALKYLNPIAASAKNVSLKSKSEDIILDIYNLKKDYKSIQSFAQATLNSIGNSVEPRKKMLTQIKEEAHFSQLKIDMEQQEPEKRIETLLSFSNEHKDSKLSKEALWQSISLAYSNGLEIKGADLSLNYHEKFPQDSKSLDSVKEAAKAYTNAGYINESIRTLGLISKLEPTKADSYTESICGLLNVNNQTKESQTCYRNLFLKADKNKRSEILVKLTETLAKNQSLSDVEGMETIIARENLEPYATQALISKANKYLTEKKYSEAFQLSLKVNSRPVDADIRAEARLIQAQILENEFISQSVKSSEAKFSLVLSMKTEKLDKAYTAYTSTIKMSKNTQIHEKALRGIDRLYSHFIESLTTMPVPASLAAADQAALKTELVKMSEPFISKKQENLIQLKAISKNTDSNDSIVWASLSADKTIQPKLSFPKANKFTAYLPTELKNTGNDFSRIPAEASDVKSADKKCDSKKITAQSIGNCILSKKFVFAENMARLLTATKENRAIGLYYMSLIADVNNQHYKSLWFIEKALALEPEISMFHYQKGKITYTYEGIDAALPSFEKSIDLKRNSKEISLISGLKSFSDKDFISASDELKKLTVDEQEKYNTSALLVESLAQKGNSAEAISTGEKFLNNFPKNIDMYLQLGRVYEEFPAHPTQSRQLAMESYQKALSKSENKEQKNWIQRKISFLSEAK